jgi:hypothetical protein
MSFTRINLMIPSYKLCNLEHKRMNMIESNAILDRALEECQDCSPHRIVIQCGILELAMIITMKYHAITNCEKEDLPLYISDPIVINSSMLKENLERRLKE